MFIHKEKIEASLNNIAQKCDTYIKTIKNKRNDPHMATFAIEGFNEVLDELDAIRNKDNTIKKELVITETAVQRAFGEIKRILSEL